MNQAAHSCRGPPYPILVCKSMCKVSVVGLLERGLVVAVVLLLHTMLAASLAAESVPCLVMSCCIFIICSMAISSCFSCSAMRACSTWRRARSSAFWGVMARTLSAPSNSCNSATQVRQGIRSWTRALPPSCWHGAAQPLRLASSARPDAGLRRATSPSASPRPGPGGRVFLWTSPCASLPER